MTVLGDRAFKEVLRSEGPGSMELVLLLEERETSETSFSLCYH